MTNHNRLKLPAGWHVPVTSACIRSLSVALLLATLPVLGWGSDSPSSEPPQIQREVISKNLPPAETAHQRIFVSFEGSPKMTRILQEKLRAKGFAVADDPASADARFKINGTYIISALAKQDIVGPLGEVLERTVQLDNKAADPRYQTVDLLQIGAIGAYRGAISVPDLLLWISQKTGIAGGFNEMLTGDPRGWCLNEKCKQVKSYVEMRVYGDGLFWRVKAQAWHEKLLMDVLIADVLEDTLAPFYRLKVSDAKVVGTERP